MEIDIDKYLKRLVVTEGDSLFGYTWGNLKNKRCPKCSLKLKLLRNQKYYICPKHKPAFLIRAIKVI
jgi:transcription initiation factor IIE alpha subunit